MLMNGSYYNDIIKMVDKKDYGPSSFYRVPARPIRVHSITTQY